MASSVKPIVTVLILCLVFLTGCASTNNEMLEKPDKNGENNQAEIINTLNSNPEVFKTTWSQDGTMVVYIQTG